MEYYGEYEREYENFLSPKVYEFHYVLRPMYNPTKYDYIVENLFPIYDFGCSF